MKCADEAGNPNMRPVIDFRKLNERTPRNPRQSQVPQGKKYMCIEIILKKNKIIILGF